MSCRTGRCRSGARCLECIERDGLTRSHTRVLRLTLPRAEFPHRMVALAVQGLEREVAKIGRVVEFAGRGRLSPETSAALRQLRAELGSRPPDYAP